MQRAYLAEQIMLTPHLDPTDVCGICACTLASVYSQQPDVGLFEGLTLADGAGFVQQAWKATIPWDFIYIPNVLGLALNP